MISTISNGIKFQKGAGLSGYVAEIGSALVCRPRVRTKTGSCGLCGKLANDSPTISARSSPLQPMRSARLLICIAFSRRRRASGRRPDVSCSVRARGGRCALPDRPMRGSLHAGPCIPPCSSRTLRWRLCRSHLTFEKEARLVAELSRGFPFAIAFMADR